jgi:hypothetical protein
VKRKIEVDTEGVRRHNVGPLAFGGTTAGGSPSRVGKKAEVND